MTDSRVTPQVVEAAARALGVKPCRVDSKNWYSCGGDDDPTEGYSCSDGQCENQDHKGRRACDNPWHRVPAALAAAVPLLCQPLQDEIDRLRNVLEGVVHYYDFNLDPAPIVAQARNVLAAVPVGTGNPTQPRADD